MRVFFLSLLFLAGCSSSQKLELDLQVQALLPERGVIVGGEIGQRLFSQCSRSAPKPDGFWTPSAEQIATLDSKFPGYIRQVFARNRAPLTDYYRQYVGFTLKGRQLVYCNFVTLSPGTHRSREYLESLLRTRPMRVCDGGDEFFGVVYDVETEAFSEYRANGAI